MSMHQANTGTTEYQEEYCGTGTRMSKAAEYTHTGVVGPIFNEDIQPVGGRLQAQARAKAEAIAQAQKGHPVYDSDFVSVVYSGADQGHHRAEPGWRDPKWTPSTRAANLTLYEPADRDPANRNQFIVYRSTLIDPLHTPAKPLPVPDVHKLRYMNNNYMCGDDWY